MKRIFTILILSGFLASCVEDESILDKPIELRTDASIDFFYVTKELDNRLNNHGVHNLLGHGYDVTGEFISITAGRKQIFDLDKISQDWPSSVSTSPANFRKGGSLEFENGQDFLKSISNNYNDLKGTASFRGTLYNLFPNQDQSKNFTYSVFTHYLPLEGHRLMAMPEEKYYVNDFKQAISNQSPEQIVKIYGTHLIGVIIMGAKAQITYRTRTDNSDRLGAALNGLNIAMENIFRPTDSQMDYEIAEGNFDQQLSFKIIGGDKSKVKIAEKDEFNMVRINYNEWFGSISKENMEMVNLVLWPIYDYVADPIKQKELKNYVEKYIKENQLGS